MTLFLVIAIKKVSGNEILISILWLRAYFSELKSLRTFMWQRLGCCLGNEKHIEKIYKMPFRFVVLTASTAQLIFLLLEAKKSSTIIYMYLGIQCFPLSSSIYGFCAKSAVKD